MADISGAEGARSQASLGDCSKGIPGGENKAGKRGQCCMFAPKKDGPPGGYDKGTVGNYCYKCGDGICEGEKGKRWKGLTDEQKAAEPKVEGADAAEPVEYKCGRRVKDDKDDTCEGKSLGERCHPELQTSKKKEAVVDWLKIVTGEETCAKGEVQFCDKFPVAPAPGARPPRSSRDPDAGKHGVCVVKEDVYAHEKCCGSTKCAGETGKETCVASALGKIGNMFGGSKDETKTADETKPKTLSGEDPRRFGKCDEETTGCVGK